ncbi:MAG: metallophosphoesterase family protein [Candidatus Nanohaloarchaea archaeon]|nr:metallophosphoesterase family protein [Candidatus Nanohaloarchaea archaeon]
MKVLALSDIHAAVGEVEDILHREQDHDLVLIAGDITDPSADDYAGAARTVLDMLDEEGGFVKAVPGNMDDERVLELLIEHRVNLHKNLFSMQDHEFVGFGGGRTPFDTPFEPADAERGEVLRQLLERATTERRVIVSHEPPADTGADVTSDGEHVGSEALRGIIDEEHVELVLSGHIHESRTVDEVAGTTVVNPGPVEEGRYAVLELDDGVDAELRG